MLNLANLMFDNGVDNGVDDDDDGGVFRRDADVDRASLQHLIVVAFHFYHKVSMLAFFAFFCIFTATLAIIFLPYLWTH